ncbi:hypothetical protein BV22DRAFT_970800, partial [Leucogyrophana mollusca]
MPRILENPNEAIQPDFTLDEFTADRAALVADGLTDDQAANALAALWRVTNNREKARWAQQLELDAQQEEEERARNEEEQRRAAETEAQRAVAKRDEEEEARKEDRKKNRAKYFPIRKRGVPTEDAIIPAVYATRRLAKGEYCELHYFTNRGLREAAQSIGDTDPDALVLMPSENGVHSWAPAGAIRDPKTKVVKDENLTWEEFSEAAPRMINAM